MRSASRSQEVGVGRVSGPEAVPRCPALGTHNTMPKAGGGTRPFGVIGIVGDLRFPVDSEKMTDSRLRNQSYFRGAARPMATDS